MIGSHEKSEYLNNTEASEVLNWTKKSLSLLKKETWINFFKNALEGIKSFFWLNEKSKQWLQESESKSKDKDYEQHETTDKLKVSETRNYIKNGGTFYSPTKWTCKRNKYRWVCSTWSFNVLRNLWLPKVSDSTEVDLKWDTLTRMWLNYIGKVNPKNPSENWYKPQDWDTAVRPKFKKKSGKITQHQATYINWHWVSDNIQNNMSCYPWEPNEPYCKIYRYTA